MGVKTRAILGGAGLMETHGPRLMAQGREQTAVSPLNLGAESLEPKRPRAKGQGPESTEPPRPRIPPANPPNPLDFGFPPSAQLPFDAPPHSLSRSVSGP